MKAATKIIIPDNKPPYTICEYNIGNLNDVGVAQKTEYVGSFFDTSSTENSEEHIFVPISGPFGTRSRLTQMLLPIFEKLNLKSVISLGMPGSSKVVRRGNCEIHSWLSAQERQEAMRKASIVIFSGGHITCFEIIKYAKPSICIPTQPEQLANAAKLQDMHCSMIARNRTGLERAIRKIQEDHAQVKTNMETLNKFSNRFDGLNRAAEIIEAAKN